MLIWGNKRQSHRFRQCAVINLGRCLQVEGLGRGIRREDIGCSERRAVVDGERSKC